MYKNLFFLFQYKSYDRMFKLYFTMHRAGYQRKKFWALFRIVIYILLPPIASVSTYNYLLMALDQSESSAVWEIAMELVKNMGHKPVVLPDTGSLNFFLMCFMHDVSYLQLLLTCC